MCMFTREPEIGVTGGQAVTIDDVVCVINSGRHKEKSYDPYTNVSTLQAAWVSKASERQRRGRAGRCQQARWRRRCNVHTGMRKSPTPPWLHESAPSKCSCRGRRPLVLPLARGRGFRCLVS